MSSPLLSIDVLGPLRVQVDGAEIAVGGPKQRSVLAMLVLAQGNVVSVDRLIDGVWGDEAHDRAIATLQVYVSNLRKLFAAAGESDLIASQRPGYLMTAEFLGVDLLRFRQAAADARKCFEQGSMAPASAAAAMAVGMWRGDALSDLTSEPFAESGLVALDEERLAVTELWFDADLAVGRHRESLAALDATVRDYPLRERFRAQQMLALYRSGRQADALAVFRETRALLIEELGIEPSPELRELEGRILDQDPALDDRVSVDRSPVVDVERTIRATSSMLRAVLVLADGVRLELGHQRWVLGRHPECDVVIDDGQVSRRHAEIRPTSSGYELVDLDSTNGVTVNDERVTRTELDPGDRIAVGSMSMSFEVER